MVERYMDIQLINWKERTIRLALMKEELYQAIDQAGGLSNYRQPLLLQTLDLNGPEMENFEVHDIFVLICKGKG